MYGWKIDRDYFDGEATGVAGPRGGMTVEDGAGEKFELYDDGGMVVPDGEGETFALYDSDENLMAKGRIVGDYDGFEPLDDYGLGMWGCAGIKYDGKWL